MSYHAGLHTASNKPYAVSGIPELARYMYYDESLFIYRPYNSVSEVLSYLDTEDKRKGSPTVLVSIAGINTEYWFRNGFSDSNLVVKSTDLTGYATESWVVNQGYLTSIPTSYLQQGDNISLLNNNVGYITLSEVPSPDLSNYYNKTEVNGLLNNKVNTSLPINNSYGIVIGGSLSTALTIGVDTVALDNRFLRKDINSNNGTNTLTLGNLIVNNNTTLGGLVTLGSLALGNITNKMLVIDSNNEVKYINMPSFGGSFNISNDLSEIQFSIDSGDSLIIEGTGDTSVAFNASTKTITINSSGGSTGGGVDSFNARTGNVYPELGDYNTDLITESSNLYFTEDRVRDTVLTDINTNIKIPVLPTDNMLTAIGKLQAQVNTSITNERTITISGTSGRTIVSGGTQDLIADREWVVDLQNGISTAGTYPKVTVDTYGRVTAGASLIEGDIPNLPASKITSGTFNIARIPTGTTSSTVAIGNDSRINNGQTAYGWGNHNDKYIVKATSSEWGSLLSTLDSGVNIDDLSSSVGYANTPSGMPANGHIFTMRRNAALSAQISAHYSNTWRVRASNTAWSDWNILWHDGNLRSDAQNDNRYLQLTGGTITGDLVVQGNTSNPSLTTFSMLVEKLVINEQIIGPSFSRDKQGLVPAPGGTGTTRYLREDGSWVVPPGSGSTPNPTNLTLGTRTNTTLIIGSSTGSGVTLPIATTSLAGLLSGTDKGLINTISSKVNRSGDDITGNFSITPTTANPTAANKIAFGYNAASGATGPYIRMNGDIEVVIRSYIHSSGYAVTFGGGLDVSGEVRATGLELPGTTSQYVRGDGTLATYANTTYSLISTTEINSTTSTTARLISGGRLNTWLSSKGFSTQTLVAGSNITISGSTISAVNTTYSAGTLAQLNTGTTTTNYLWSPKTIADYVKAKYTAGTGISISSTGVISNTAPNIVQTSVTGNAGTATRLATARLIGGVSFNGTANINLPGVNTVGNQNTTGSAATLTTSRTLWGRPFNGSANVSGALTSVTTITASGNITTAGDLLSYTSSDMRLKDFIKPIQNPLEMLSKISGNTFTWNDKQDTYSGEDYGLLYQEIKEIMPHAVTLRDNGYGAVKYDRLIPLLVEGIKSLVDRINELEGRLSDGLS